MKTIIAIPPITGMRIVRSNMLREEEVGVHVLLALNTTIRLVWVYVRLVVHLSKLVIENCPL